MATRDSYDALAKKLGFPGSARLRAILHELMTPEQADLADALPGTVAELAEKTHMSVEEARRELDDMFAKGIVFPKGGYTKRDEYRFVRNVLQLHDSTLATQQLMVEAHRGFFQKWHDFCLEEMYPAMVALYRELPAQPSRVVPAFKSIKDLPGVLPHEDFHELLYAQETIAVVPCSCRFRTVSVDEPCKRHKETRLWVCLQFGRGAEYVIARGSGRRLTTKQAIELADTIEDHGLIHMWANSSATTGVNTSCQCCDDCCMNYVAATRAGAPIDIMWQKSRFEAQVFHPDQCNGCEDCVERCPFGAITMEKGDQGEILTSKISSEKCFGCGVCVVGCPSGALQMKAVRPPEFIPDAAKVERVTHS